MITIVGMGMTQDDLTLRGRRAVCEASQVVVRTAKTTAAKTLAALGVPYISCDDLYDSAQDFDQLLDLITARVQSLGDCVYCVDGSGLQDALLTRRGLDVCVIPGVDAACYALAQCRADGRVFLRCSATDIVANAAFFAPDATLVVDEIDDVLLAGELQLRLLDAYGECTAYWACADGVSAITIDQVARQKGYGHDACLVIPATRFEDKKRFSFVDLVRILQRLRAPDGCDWDKVQTHQSIRDCCIEEAYELVEAIDLDDVDKMIEETGDVLLQAVFHASIGADVGEFDVADMISGVCQKLLHRHPHVFGTVKATNADEALSAWEAAKAVEKKQVTYTQKMQQVAPMSALMRAKKLQKIAAKAHYDFTSVDQAADKIAEELDELLHADPDQCEMEGGDLLFSCVNVLRLMHVDPELALLQSTRKFTRRFAAVESALAQQGKRIDEVTADELWTVYDRIKAEDKA